jgi:hypothetical protein
MDHCHVLSQRLPIVLDALVQVPDVARARRRLALQAAGYEVTADGLNLRLRKQQAYDDQDEKDASNQIPLKESQGLQRGNRP